MGLAALIIDTSAIVAILLREVDFERYLDAILDDREPRISAASVLEVHVVMVRRFSGREIEIDPLLARLRVRIEPVAIRQLALAREAFGRYGQGRHLAKLNFGDCFAYALAKAMGYPLLYKGDDFARTDIEAALV